MTEAALDEMVPSVDLVRALAGFDLASAAGADVEVLAAAFVGWERVIAWATACQNEVLVQADRVMAAPEFEMGYADAIRWYPDHLGLMVNMSGGSMAHRINQAIHLVDTLPHVHAALKAGALTTRHADTAARVTRVLHPEVAHAVDAAVMVRDDWRTPSQLEKSLTRTILELDPAGAALRHAARRKERDVRTRNEADGMVSLSALLPAEQGTAVAKKIDAYARSSSATRQPGDGRTLAQRRADTLVDLILRDGSDCADTAGAAGPGAPGNGPTLHGKAPEIWVMVAQSTLMGADDAPAYLAGYGWITPTIAARIAADPNSVWRRLIVDPVTGRLLDFGRDTYRPPQDAQDFVIARDQSCTFPTCDLPAVLCDLDHLDDWIDGGHTAAELLEPACRRHHKLRHDGGWQRQRDPDTGDSIWIEPSGKKHIKPATELPCPAPVEPPQPDDQELGDPPF